MDTDPRSVTQAESGSGFASYLAKRLVAEKGFRPGVPDEAARLGDGADFALTYADLNLVLACIVDRQTDREKHFGFSKQELLELGKACLKYTGRINGTKMPVSIVVYEVGNGPATAEDLVRLLSVSKSFPGLAKVTIQAHYLDTSQGEVWTSVGPQRFLRRLGMRTWLDRLLVEPPKADVSDAELEVAMPNAPRRSLATFFLLALLAGVFVVEQTSTLGAGGGSGPLGVGVETLWALGGMSAEAVLTQGQWYRVLVAPLLHADAFHLLFNGLALGLAGYLVESWVGAAWFVSLFSVGAIGGSLLGLFLNPHNVVSVGASGAAMALLAAGVVLSLRFPRGVERTKIQIQLLQFLIPSLIPIVAQRGGGHVDFAAHFGGALAGAAFAAGLLKVWPRTAPEPRFSPLGRGLAFLFVLGFVASVLIAESHYAAYSVLEP